MVINKKSKLSTRCVMNVSSVVCKVWKVVRCKLWRDIDDFDYYISDLRSQYPNTLVYTEAVRDLPYYCKTVEVDDEYERTSSIKIGDAVIQYTFNKLRRQGLIEDSEVIPLFEHYDPYKSTIENVIAQTKLSHNRPDKLKVIKLNRKENNVLQLHNK